MFGFGGSASRVPELRRALTFWPLVLYGLAAIVGAGIYVAIGTVIRRADGAAPLSFLLAGIAAGLTGLCYAELSGRFPEAAGGVAYVRHAFGSERLAQVTGAAITVEVAVAAASIARGAVHYLVILFPFPAPLLTTALVAGFTGIALVGVRESVGLAAAMAVIEIAGLLWASAAGLLAAHSFHVTGLVPGDLAGWRGTFAGAFVAFFAFAGFETLANMAEEVKNPEHTLPRGILGAVAASIVLYVMVSSASVFGNNGSGHPLLGLFEGANASIFAAIGSIAVANGVLVQIVMLARLFYGMAVKGELPGWLGRVDPRTRTPATATMLSGAIILAVSLLAPFESLLVITNAITLCVFVLVDLSLWRVQLRTAATANTIRVPHWVPPLAASVALLLLLAEMIS